MASSLYNQYVWLVDTFRTSGRLTKREIDALWAKSPLNEKKEKVYPIRSFHRHREAVTELFGLYIVCDKLDDNRYYLSEKSDLHGRALPLHLCNVLAFSNLLLEQPDLQKRVQFEEDNSGAIHLSAVLNAMRAKHAILLTFKGGQLPQAVIPYCLYEYQHTWLLAAKPADGNGEVQVYQLNEVASTSLTKIVGSMPRWFNSDVFFASWVEAHQPVKKVKKSITDSKAEKSSAKKAEKPAPKVVEKAATKKVENPLAEQLSLF